MTKLHFDDLTQITCPFGMLDDDTQRRLDDHAAIGGEVEIWLDYGWSLRKDINREEYLTYRAKPKPRRLVTWVYWDKNDACCAETLADAKRLKDALVGYIYRIERDEDGSNPTIELVETSSVAADNEVKGGKDE